MVLITEIPTELIHLVAKELRNQDLRSLRRTCQNLNAKLRELHLDSIYRTQRIFMVPVYLENFIKFSKSRSAQTTRARARELNICFQMPYLSPVPLEYRSDPGVASLSVAGLQHVRDVEKMCGSRQHIELLKTIFSIFKNVRTLSFENSPKKGPSYLELSFLYPSLGLKRGVKPSSIVQSLHMGWMYLSAQGRGVENWIWSDTLESMASTGLGGITAIGFRNNYGMQGINISQFDKVSADTLLVLKSGLPNLRRLELYVNFNNCNDNPCTGFGQWLESIGHQLEDLSLSNTGNVFWARPHQTLYLPTAVGLPKLRRLRVELMTLDVINLQDSLRNSLGLEVLRISGCWFHGISTGQLSAFQLLKFACENLRNLRKFELQLLHDYLGFGSVAGGNPEPSSMLLEVDGYWGSDGACTARVTRSSDSGVAILDDISSEIRRRPELSDDERAEAFWKSVLGSDYLLESSDESERSS
ncbi:hypothetical protein TWF481_002145 [Arthrobotrys musiformis]|uniref:F-box domain-containing protein n=1 Tax=Arthrobotrys musiformis TaxID=47236 RepID=A0AAV9VSC0_9PEZI